MARTWYADVIRGFTDGVPLSGGITRRGLVGLLAGGVAALDASSHDLVAKKKKKTKKKKKAEPLEVFDWFDSWNTTLSNGVKGIATFGVNGFLEIVGTYSNSVGSGTLSCVTDNTRGTSLHCLYEQTSDGTSGGFSIALTDKNHWFGSYFVDDGGGFGTWAGVRR
jgi:hypothetical protein